MEIIYKGIKPERATEASSGYDLRATLEHPTLIMPGERLLIGTGLHIAMGKGYEAQIRSRSGLAIKHGIIVLNSPGTIDSDYRGEIKVILYNAGKKVYTINPGERIAQLIFAKVYYPEWINGELPLTGRGINGFGSTDKKYNQRNGMRL